MAAELIESIPRLEAEENWVTLHWDRYAITVPQQQVKSVELSADVKESLPTELAAGWFPASPKPYPIYRFDERMWPTRGLTTTGFVMLLGEDEPWGIWGDSVNVERSDTLPRVLELPSIFKRTVSPAEAFAVAEDGKPVLVCSQHSLSRWINALLARRAR